MRLSCTQAVLQCLERGERIAFVLSDVFELSSAHPDYAAPQSRLDAIVALLESGRFPLLE